MVVKKTEYIKFGENLYEIIPPLPSGTDRGGIIASPKESTDTVEIKLGGDGKLYAPAYPDLSNIDTSEIQAQIDELEAAIGNKADSTHNHEITDVTNLQTKLDEINSEIDQKANTSDLTLHKNDTIVHITESERSKLVEAYEHAQLTHAPNDAEKNIIVGVVVNGEELSVDENRKLNISTHTLLTQGTSVILGDDFLLSEVAASVSGDNEGNVLMRCSSISGISVTDDGDGNVHLTI